MSSMLAETATLADGDRARAGLLTWAAPMIRASMCRHHARGVPLDTMAFYVLDLRDTLALRLADFIRRRFGGPYPSALAGLSRPPTLLGALPAAGLADVTETAGDDSREASAALRCTLVSGSVPVLVVAAGGAAPGVLRYRIEPIETKRPATAAE